MYQHIPLSVRKPNNHAGGKHLITLSLILISLFNVAPSPDDESLMPLLHTIADRVGTDKALRRGHGYVGLYSMLLEHKRHSIRNVTEIGILTGLSMLLWAEYFPQSQLWGLDVKVQQVAKESSRHNPRIHLLEASSQDPDTPRRLNLANKSMDLIIDDGDHSSYGNTRTIEIFWPLLRPGGLYVIEDVATGSDARGKYSGKLHAPGYAEMAHNVTGALRRIYMNNDVFFADTLVGTSFKHNRYVQLQVSRSWMKDPVNHNGHLVVIRKRDIRHGVESG